MRSFFLTFLLMACDGGQPVHELDPSLSRMMEQPRANAYSAAMREPPAGTRTLEDQENEDAGLVLTRDHLEQGHERFDVLCATCHGVEGNGQSAVADKMLRRPPSLFEARLLGLSPNELHEVVHHGYGLMPSFASKLSASEEWDVVAYVLALRLSRHAIARDLPADMRAELEREAP